MSWSKDGWPSFHDPIYLIHYIYRVTRCQPFEPHMDIIAFSFITSLIFYIGLGTPRCKHDLIRDFMSSRLDRRIVIHFILRYHDLSSLTSSLPLISHFTISVLPFSFTRHFTYDAAFDFSCVLVFHMFLYGGRLNLFLIPPLEQ